MTLGAVPALWGPVQVHTSAMTDDWKALEGRQALLEAAFRDILLCLNLCWRLHAACFVLASMCFWHHFNMLMAYRMLQLMSSLLWSLMPMGHTWQLGTRGAGWCCLRRSPPCR